MKIIHDIRLFRSTIANIDGNPLPSDFTNAQLHTHLHRIVMKLREQGFSLGDFDHLYLNFTTCLETGTIRPANRRVDPYHKWYRFYDIGIGQDVYDRLEQECSFAFVISQLEKLLIAFFMPENSTSVKDCICQAVDQGEQMLVHYKTKEVPNRKASIYLQYLDKGQYLPHLFVWDCDGKELLHKVLNASMDLHEIGEIQLSSKKVTVKQKKNSFSINCSPIVFILSGE